MKKDWNTRYIQAKNINQISRGKPEIAVRYLNQFLELIPPKVGILQEGLRNEDRQGVRNILHNICPQLQFFGIPGVVPPIQKIAVEYQRMPWAEMERMVESIIDILARAGEEVEEVLATQF